MDKPLDFGVLTETETNTSNFDVLVESESVVSEFDISIDNKDEFSIDNNIALSGAMVEQKLSESEKEMLEKIKDDYAINLSYTKEGVKEIILSDEFISLTESEKLELYDYIEGDLVKNDSIIESSVDDVNYDERLISNYAGESYNPMENEVGIYDETVFYTDEEIKAMQEHAAKLYEEQQNQELFDITKY